MASAAEELPDRVRLATFNSGLSRDGPGLLLRDILRGDDPQIDAALTIIAAAEADILLLTDVDYDGGGHALAALADALAERGAAYPHLLALRPNTGRPTGLDIDGNGRLGEPRDAQGYGRFAGDGGMALLSRWPFGPGVRDHTAFLWRDLPDTAAPGVLTEAGLDTLRLAAVAAWDVPVLLPEGPPLHVLALHASPPVFDGPEDRNGLRNRDELRFWQLYLDGWSPDGRAFSAERFALMGTLNLDPLRGEGRREALHALLAHPALQDPAPARPGGGNETADWSDPVPGDLRVDYVLPAATLRVAGSGVLWPEDDLADPPLSVVAAASDHRLVWIDLVPR